MTTSLGKGSQVTAATPHLEPLETRNLRYRIGERIRAAILSGAYSWGDQLVESYIANQLGVSRAPVREALSALEKEGLIKSIPRRGYFVREFTLRDIEEIYSLRLLLEAEALRRIVGHINEDDIARLQHIVDKLYEAALAGSDPGAVIEWDMRFHRRLCELADHSRLYSAWANMGVQTELLIGVTSRTHDPGDSREWHQSLVDAIRQKNVGQAVRFLTEHLLDAQQRASAALALAQAEEQEDSV
jgi:DNA-binding GntR family transcriptional regulator